MIIIISYYIYCYYIISSADEYLIKINVVNRCLNCHTSI